jgi:asparagine synthase (glutamine-hydrolysing)
MCGVAGVVYADPARPVERACLERMAAALVHRGPDDQGIWIGPGIGLAHRRLSIIDLSPAGHQPMPNEDGTILVTYNGEIYNFEELRRELEAAGHRFRSRTDSEVLVHLYEERGDDMVQRLEGMFAFALWDAGRRRLLLARDRLGKKPLKVAELEGGGLAFASELKALFASGLVEPRARLLDVHDYLTFGYVPAPGTGFEGIRKLPAAHRLVYERGASRLERYWEIDFNKKQLLPVDEWREAVRGEVKRAVRRRLISDVPLGAFLSGGIDSSIVVACMAEASSRPVETFSMGFEHETYNELPYAKQVADRYATRHHEFHVRADDFGLLPRLARHYEEPYGDPSALASWILARETRRAVTVALNGDGGDEGFSGYTRYARTLDWRRRGVFLRRSGMRAGLALARGMVAPLSRRLENRLEAAILASSGDLAEGYGYFAGIFSPLDKRRLYGDAMRTLPLGPSLDRMRGWLEDPNAGEHPLDRMAYADLQGYLPDDLLVKMDMASMAFGLEARSPLLDPRVLELAASAPAAVRAPRGALKSLLRESFREAVPPDLIDRPKRGFGLPLSEWFRGAWAPLARELLLGGEARVHAYLRPRELRRTLDLHLTRRLERGAQIWHLVMLELWHRHAVEYAEGDAT